MGILGFFRPVALVWEAASRARLVDPLFLPAPSQIWKALEDMTLSGELAKHLGASLLTDRVRLADRNSRGHRARRPDRAVLAGRSAGLPFISALFPVPKIALLPLLILWFGIGEASKIATIALGVFFPMAVSTYAGIDNVPRNLIRMAQSFNVPFPKIILNVVMPAMLPSVLSGFRISASIALILVVSAEMIGANTGIGALLLTSGNLMQTDQLMAGIVAIAIMGILIGAFISWLERVLLGWR